MIEQVSDKIKYYEDSTGIQVNTNGKMLIIQERAKVPSGSLAGRGSIDKFSCSSAVRMRRYLRGCKADYKYMVTLTYPHAYPLCGKESKQHLKRFLQELKRYSQRHKQYDENAWSIFWFMEFQERGAIHYHMFTTATFGKKFLATLWYEIVGSEDPRHKIAGTRIEKLQSGRQGTISYATKYAVKQSQKDVPEFLENCGRFWGICGIRIVVAAAIWVSNRAIKAQKVKREMEKLKNTVKRGLALENIKKIDIFKTRENRKNPKNRLKCNVYIIEDAKTLLDINRSMYLIMNSLFLEDLSVYDFYCEEFLTDYEDLSEWAN